MENKKINIAELLKDCPSGMELNCTIWDDVTFAFVSDDSHYPITIRTPDGQVSLNKYGCYSNGKHSKCVIFPKDKNTWEGFQRPFKDRDVAISDKGDIHLLRTEDSSYCAYRKYAWRSSYEFDSTITTMVKVVRLATEEEKQKLFDAIKDNGYRWNTETKTLEKLVEPIFKVGNKIRRKNVDYTYIVTIAKFDDDYYDYVNEDGQCGVIHISKQNEWELVPNEFDPTTLKPFDKVLVRNYNSCVWKCGWYSHYSKYPYHYVCTDTSYIQCIPFEDNEHLLGTTQDCDGYFKTWE